MTGPFPDWIYRQSAILPFRRRVSPSGDGLEVLLINTRDGKRWTFPKGIVEPGMSDVASAVKEAWEEAGVRGPVSREALGAYRRKKWGGACKVTLFAMEVEEAADEWPECGFRKRLWVPLEDAAARLRPQGLRNILKALSGRLAEEPLVHLAEPLPRLIYLFRHAKSSWADPLLADHERPLAPRGQKACAAMAAYFRVGDIRPELVICSTAARTRETLAAVRPVFGEAVQVRLDHALYLTEAWLHLELLRCQPESLRRLMVIGHNPGLELFADMLAGGGDAAARRRMAEKFPTAAMAILVHRGQSWRDLEPGSCELHSFVVPRELDHESAP